MIEFDRVTMTYDGADAATAHTSVATYRLSRATRIICPRPVPKGLM